MSESRKIIQDKSKITLKRVKPCNTLFFGPMPCEDKAAAIRNKTVNSMERGDIGDVSYRYLQSRQGLNNSLKVAIPLGSISTIMLFGLTRRFRLVGLLSAIPSVLPSVLYVPPNIGHAIRYSETKRSCEDWLSSRLAENKIKEIKAMKFNNFSFYSLNNLLARENINNSSVASRIHKR